MVSPTHSSHGSRKSVSPLTRSSVMSREVIGMPYQMPLTPVSKRTSVGKWGTHLAAAKSGTRKSRQSSSYKESPNGSLTSLPTRNTHTTPITQAALKSTTYPTKSRLTGRSIASRSRSVGSKTGPSTTKTSTRLSASVTPRASARSDQFKTYVPGESTTRAKSFASLTHVSRTKSSSVNGNTTHWNPMTAPGSRRHPVSGSSINDFSSVYYDVDVHVPTAGGPRKEKRSACCCFFWIILVVAAVLLAVWGVLEITGNGWLNSPDKDNGSDDKKDKNEKQKPKPPTDPEKKDSPEKEDSWHGDITLPEPTVLREDPTQIVRADCQPPYRGGLPNEHLCDSCGSRILQTPQPIYRNILNRRYSLYTNARPGKAYTNANRCCSCGESLRRNAPRKRPARKGPNAASIFSSNLNQPEYREHLARFDHTYTQLGGRY